MVRATKLASAPRASDTGLNGVSSEPNGVDFVTLPCSEVGEYWPLVSPYIRLLKSRILILTLRRRAWIRWLPPIDRASPSPVMTQTERSGREAASPVAIAGARPWIECIP